LASGRDVFLEIEVQGAMQVRKKMPEGIYIFLTPPDLESLHERLVGRGTDSDSVIAQRVETAKEELKMMINYDYAVENDRVAHAVDRIKAIITAERLKVGRVVDQYL
jgi:guanylate kinase